MTRPPGRASTRNTRLVLASPEAVYRGFMDPAALGVWLAPESMTGKVHWFEGSVGGGYGMSLYYPPSAPGARGKTAEREDRFTARFCELVPGRRIEQAITFDSEDPAFSGEMRMLVSFEAEGGATRVTIAFDDIPPGIRPEDNEAGTASTLEKLARWVESGGGG